MDITNGYRTIELKMYIIDGYNKTDIAEDFFAGDEGIETRALRVTEGYCGAPLCSQLAFWADMADEWNKADAPNPVIYEIAKKLGVEVI